MYPLNRYALIPSESDGKQSLYERIGLQYIPFYTPTKSTQIPLPSPAPTEPTDKIDEQVSPSHCHDESPFTQEELIRFKKRFEEGFDLKTDEIYNHWLIWLVILLYRSLIHV